jgi:t-SNARE complex subunit (syntaxin)
MGWNTDAPPIRSNKGSSNNNNNNEYNNDTSSSGSDGSTDNKTGGVLEVLANDIQNYASLRYRLMELNKLFGSTRDNEKFREKVKSTRQKGSQVEQRISKHLDKQLGSMRVLNETKRKQLQKLNHQFLLLKREFAQDIKESHRLERKFSDNQKSGDGVYGSNSGRTSYMKNESDSENDEEEDAIVSDGDRNSMTLMIDRRFKQKRQEEKKREKQQMSQFTSVISVADSSTVNVEKTIALETNKELASLEADFLELNECFRDLNTLIHEQDESINTIHANVTSARENVEIGVETLKATKNMNLENGVKTGINKIISIGRWLS